MATMDTGQIATPRRPPPAGGLHPAQVIALVVGVLYLLVGLFGYIVTGFSGWVVDTNEEFLGFDLNGFHNFVHIGVGLILILASMAPSATITQGVLIGGGLVYLLAAVLGFTTGAWTHLLSIDQRGDPENFLHLFSGLAAIASGFLGRPEEPLPLSRGSAQPGAMAPGTGSGEPGPSERAGGPPGMQRRW